jgi:hypothetical protein
LTRINTTVLLDQHRRAVAAALADLQPQSWAPETLPEAGGGSAVRLCEVTQIVGVSWKRLKIKLQKPTYSDTALTVWADDGPELVAHCDPWANASAASLTTFYTVGQYYLCVQVDGRWVVMSRPGDSAGVNGDYTYVKAVVVDATTGCLIGADCYKFTIVNGRVTGVTSMPSGCIIRQ